MFHLPKSLTILSLLTVVLMMTSVGTAQLDDLFSDPDEISSRQPPSVRSRPGRPGAPTRVKQVARVVVEQVHEEIPPEELARGQQLAELKAKIKAAKDDATRQQLGAQFRDMVESIFDKDLQRRERELAKVEARINKLRNVVDRRKEARDRIIDLQVNSVMLEAEGLTFPTIIPPLLLSQPPNASDPADILLDEPGNINPVPSPRTPPGKTDSLFRESS